MDETLLFTLTSPSLHFRQTGSFLQFILTSSPRNSDRRAPTIYVDEPFTTLQMDGLLLTIHIDELLLFTLTSPLLHFKQTGSFPLFTLTSPSLHIRQTGSCLQILLTSSPLNSDGRAPTTYIDEPFTAY